MDKKMRIIRAFASFFKRKKQGDSWKGGGKEVVEMLKRGQPALELKTMRVARSI